MVEHTRCNPEIMGSLWDLGFFLLLSLSVSFLYVFPKDVYLVLCCEKLS